MDPEQLPLEQFRTEKKNHSDFGSLFVDGQKTLLLLREKSEETDCIGHWVDCVKNCPLALASKQAVHRDPQVGVLVLVAFLHKDLVVTDLGAWVF